MIKNRISNLLSLVLIFFFTLNVKAQEGQIKMTLEKIGSKDEQTNQMLQMGVGSEMSFSFKGDKQLLELSILGGMISAKSLMDTKNKDVEMTFDMGGQKFYSKDNIIASKDEGSESVKDYVVKYDKNDKKKIAGYDCYLANVSSSSNPDMKLKVYITKDIKGEANFIPNTKDLKLEGFPLGFEMDGGDINVSIVATAYNATVADDVFKVSKDGAKEMTKDELFQMMPGLDMLLGK